MDDNPVVFLSHSSKDKAALMALKNLLDTRAAGSLDFFLSSDGQSIRLGRNWVAKISDALTQCKLMFVFLSPASIDSKWVHFEAGCAYAKGIDVVPVCLMGMDFNQVAQPLSLLQGFNLHTHDALSNLARICNQNFKRKLNEAFTQEEFLAIFADSLLRDQGFFGQWALAIHEITIKADYEVREVGSFNPIPILEKIATEAKAPVFTEELHDQFNRAVKRLEVAGCDVSFLRTEFADSKRGEAAELECSLSPQLFHLNAPLLDSLFKQLDRDVPWNVVVRFSENVYGEKVRHALTSKLFTSGIRAVDRTQFDFDDFRFILEQRGSWVLDFTTSGSVYEKRLAQVVEKLFKYGVLFETNLSLP